MGFRGYIDRPVLDQAVVGGRFHGFAVIHPSIT